MRQCRSSGSVEGVTSNRHLYSDRVSIPERIPPSSRPGATITSTASEKFAVLQRFWSAWYQTFVRNTSATRAGGIREVPEGE